MRVAHSWSDTCPSHSSSLCDVIGIIVSVDVVAIINYIARYHLLRLVLPFPFPKRATSLKPNDNDIVQHHSDLVVKKKSIQYTSIQAQR